MDFNLDSIQQQPVSDDPELVKALAGINSEAELDTVEGLQFEGLAQSPVEIEATPEVEVEPVVVPATPVAPIADEPAVAPQPARSAEPIAPIADLDSIKISALHDLRPLMEKLDVSAEEKFNIYLLLLRSSDDKTLIKPAYETARSIEDETARANALLDIIKETDYFNSKNS